MRRSTSAWLLGTLLLCSCGGGSVEEPSTWVAPDGFACIGDNYAFWNGAEARAKAEACLEPVEGAVIRVTEPDGEWTEWRSGADGRFSLVGADLEEGGAKIFVDGPLGIGGMELSDAPGPTRLLRPDAEMLFVTFPRAAVEALPQD